MHHELFSTTSGGTDIAIDSGAKGAQLTAIANVPVHWPSPLPPPWEEKVMPGAFQSAPSIERPCALTTAVKSPVTVICAIMAEPT